MYRGLVLLVVVALLLGDAFAGPAKRKPKPKKGRPGGKLPPRADFDGDDADADNFDYNNENNDVTYDQDDSDSDAWNSPDTLPADDEEPSAPLEEDEGEGEDPPDCECVNFSQCDEEYRVITSGSGMVDWRTSVKQCGDIEVCCTKPNPAGTEEGGEEFPEEFPDEGGSQPHEPMSCGVAMPKADVSSFGGGSGPGFAVFDEFPWMLLLSAADGALDSMDEFKCGASLIHPQVALTAAHCLVEKASQSLKLSAENIVVTGGEWDRDSTSEPTPTVERHVSKIIMHPEFSVKHPKNDIALLILKDPFELSDHINTICLPVPGHAPNTERCTSGGWGKVHDVPQTLLRKVELPVVSNKACQAALRKSRLGKHFILHPSFMCAGGHADEDVCVGDGGGPLFCPSMDGDSVTQIGVVAWGIDCGVEGRPGVYTDVRAFLPWIQNEMKNNGVSL